MVERAKEICDRCGEPLGPNPVMRGEKVYCCQACAFEAQRPADCGGRSDSVIPHQVVLPESYEKTQSE